MAVYTTLERGEIEAFIERFGLGTLLRYEGVASGIENTNYFLTIDRRDATDEHRPRHRADFVLTLFENQSEADLGFHVRLLQLLNRRGLPVPAPLQDVDGIALHSLLGRPTLLMPRVAGEHPIHPSAQQCQALGETLAAIHRTTRDAELQHPSHRGLAWLVRAAAKVRPHLDAGQIQLLDQQLAELDMLEGLQPTLPQGVIHGDLFRDNALFQGGELSGIIDFFSAGSGYLLLDLAIVANDWCYPSPRGFDHTLLTALLSGYQSKRALTDSEREQWPAMLRLAALRFWVSRLESRYAPERPRPVGALAELKDPAQYQAILQSHRDQPCLWPPELE